MTQMDLLDFVRTHARRTDPQTSVDAAAHATGLAADHHAKIMAYLRGIYPAAAIYHDIAAAIGIEPHAVGKRMKELQQAGQAVPLVGRTATTRSGRQARVWRAVA